MKEEGTVCSFCKTIVIDLHVIEKNNVIICENCIRRMKNLLNEKENEKEKI